MRCWLLKTEPSSFSFDDLLRAPRRTTGWGGVRNYQARNLLRDELKKGDRVLVYHSNAAPPCVVGEAEVVREGHPDPTQFEKADHHYDPEALPGAPRWFQVEIRALRPLAHSVSLERIRRTAALGDMLLVRRGMRLSVQPVTEREYRTILRLSRKPE